MTLLLEVTVRALLIAAGTAVVLWALRIRPAAVKHAAWTAVVLTMLALPIWMAGGVTFSLPVLRPAPGPIGTSASDAAAVALDAPPMPEHETASPMVSASQAAVRTANWWDILAGTYVLGVFVLLARLLIGTLQANRLRRRAVMRTGRLTSERCAAPITIGWFSPALILPPDWPHWPAAKLAAVLTHEAEHARRRDPLAQWLALLNRAVFWFHPLSWWLERRLAILAEEACDAAVIAAGHSPEKYSEYLLDLARSMTRQGRRLNVVGMAMPGSGLDERMRQIFDGLPMTRVSRARMIGTVALCAMSSIVFAAGTLSPRTSMSVAPRSTAGMQTPGAVPRFDVVSVKPCDPNNLGSGGSRSGGAGSISPGRLVENCLTVFNMIQNAYIGFADGRRHDPWGIRHTPIEGGPDWVRHDPYMVEATADGTASQTMMRGPMLQAVLEDRFHLTLHHDSRPGPVYELVVAASGSKLRPAKDGVCVPPDWTVFPMPPLPDDQHRCAITLKRFDAKGKEVVGYDRLETSTYTLTWDDEAISLDDLATEFLILDRPVVNKTGIAGLVSFHLTHQGDRANPPDHWPNSYADVAAADLKAQLGLELRPSTGPLDSLVIDHVERPVPNESVGLQAAAGARAATDKAPKFDVASIKECGPNAPPTGGRAGSAGSQASPGYLNLSCLTLKQFVNMAYAGPDSPLLNRHGGEDYVPDRPKSVRGGPSWAYSETYTIEAKADGVTDRNILTGPMLRALLEDRFQLKTHRATEQQSMYTLTVAKSGLKIAPTAPGECWLFEPGKPAPPHDNGVGPCGSFGGDGWGSERADGVWLGDPSRVPEGFRMVDLLWRAMFRVVIDKTGLNGRYSFALDFTPDDTTPGVQGRGRPGLTERPTTFKTSDTIFQALEKLGLHLAQTNEPSAYIVIDSAQKPKPNSPTTAGAR